MRETLRRLIADFQERELPAGIEREPRLPMLPGKCDAVIGMRRSGKTFLCYQTISALLNKKGMTKDRILFFNFEDERLLPLRTEQLGFIPELFYENNPDNKHRECFFFFDEIQRIPGWELFIRRLMDTEKARIIITGSSAKLLSREIATALRGRSLATEVFPFSFREYLRFHGALPDHYTNPGSAGRAQLQKKMSEYSWGGGFPEAQSLSEEFRVKLLQGYVDVVLFRDVVERHGGVNVEVLRYLIRQAAASVTGYFSTNKFYHSLKSAGIVCTKNSLYDYLGLLEDAFFLFPVTISSKSERAKKVNPRKLYLADTGLITAMTSRTAMDSGVLLENMVYSHFRKTGSLIEYCRTASGKDVDFLITPVKGTPFFVQACADISAAATRERELSGLKEIMKETGIKSGKVVTLRDHETVKFPHGEIEILPAWELMLNR